MQRTGTTHHVTFVDISLKRYSETDIHACPPVVEKLARLNKENPDHEKNCSDDPPGTQLPHGIPDKSEMI